MKRLGSSVVAGALLALSAGAFSAAIPSSFSSTAGTPYDAAALTGFATHSADMVGSSVTVSFANGSSETVAWTLAGALGSGFSMVMPGDSFTAGIWLLTNLAASAITGFTIDGRPGNTVFDLVPGVIGSPGSATGRAFDDVDGTAALALATARYSDQLSVGGVFYDDLYLVLDVRFGGGLVTAASVAFSADTDTADIARGGITASIPEPGTSILLLAGLLAFGAVARRRSQR